MEMEVKLMVSDGEGRIQLSQESCGFTKALNLPVTFYQLSRLQLLNHTCLYGGPFAIRFAQMASSRQSGNSNQAFRLHIVVSKVVLIPPHTIRMYFPEEGIVIPFMRSLVEYFV